MLVSCLTLTSWACPLGASAPCMSRSSWGIKSGIENFFFLSLGDEATKATSESNLDAWERTGLSNMKLFPPIGLCTACNLSSYRINLTVPGIPLADWVSWWVYWPLYISTPKTLCEHTALSLNPCLINLMPDYCGIMSGLD